MKQDLVFVSVSRHSSFSLSIMGITCEYIFGSARFKSDCLGRPNVALQYGGIRWPIGAVISACDNSF